jgi:tetratricopeptide (TPR) repeat protein
MRRLFVARERRTGVHATLGFIVAMSKRLDFLVKLTREQGAEKADPFAWYGLAMEYRSLERYDEALATFEVLRSRTPDYVPMYLMCGQMLEKVGRVADARAWLSAGAEQARKRGDAHALGELEGALQALG